jgi:hypothetical protein
MKVRDLVHASARVIGIVASGENMTDAELSDAVSSLNMLLGQWSTSRDYVFSTQEIEIDLRGFEFYRVEAKLISDDAKLNGEEIKIYRDITQNKPKNCIEYAKVLNEYVVNVPQKITGKLIIQSLISPQFPLKATDDVLVPDEYVRAIKYALAIELAPEYQLPITQDVQQQYQQAMRIMHRAQSTPTPVKPDRVLMNIGRGRHWGYHD